MKHFRPAQNDEHLVNGSPNRLSKIMSQKELSDTKDQRLDAASRLSKRSSINRMVRGVSVGSRASLRHASPTKRARPGFGSQVV